MSTIVTRLGSLAAASVLLGASLVAAPVGHSSAEAACSTKWGSLDKVGYAQVRIVKTPSVSGVRTGHHACFDRVVIDLTGLPEGALMGYTKPINIQTGRAMSLRGGADIQILIPARPRTKVPSTNYRTVRQVAYAGSAKGVTSYVIGTRARLPFRAFVLQGPGKGSRLVVDVAHKW